MELGKSKDRFIEVDMEKEKEEEKIKIEFEKWSVEWSKIKEEKRLEWRIDLRISRIEGKVEEEMVVLGKYGGIIGDERDEDKVVMEKISNLKR